MNKERIMNIKEYFDTTQGKGFMATASSDGNVDIAVYSRPHVLEDGTLAFIMRDRLTHAYLQDNDHATYAFLENNSGYKGIRLFMKKTGEDTNEELIASMTRRHLSPEEDAAKGPKFIVYFSIGKILTLIGGQELEPNNL
jgi:hypothetical protein